MRERNFNFVVATKLPNFIPHQIFMPYAKALQFLDSFNSIQLDTMCAHVHMSATVSILYASKEPISCTPSLLGM